MQYLLNEVGIADPRLREPFRSSWDGLERFGRSAVVDGEGRRGRDQIAVVDEYGNESNSFLDELVDIETSPEEAADLWKSLIKLGLTKEEASALSGFIPRKSVRK